jgi:arginyl-tRNA synthetase
MLKIKQELLAGLAQALDQLSPGAGDKAAFESPKVAAHGDYAITAAMQLAKPLRLNPRQVGESLKAALLALPVYRQWVADIEIAGPGFLNLRLTPAAKQQIVKEVLQAGKAFGVQPSNGQRLMVEFVSANPTGPLHVGHGRQAALGDAICNLYSTQGWDVHREFYYNDAGCASRASSLVMPSGPKPPTTATTSRTLPTIFWQRKRCTPTTANSPPAATRTRWKTSASSPWPTCATSRTWTCRRSR